MRTTVEQELIPFDIEIFFNWLSFNVCFFNLKNHAAKKFNCRLANSAFFQVMGLLYVNFCAVTLSSSKTFCNSSAYFTVLYILYHCRRKISTFHCQFSGIMFLSYYSFETAPLGSWPFLTNWLIQLLLHWKRSALLFARKLAFERTVSSLTATETNIGNQ